MRLSVIGTNGQTSGVLADTEGSGQMRADRTFTVSSVPSTVAITNVQLDVPLSGWMRYFHTVTGGTASSQWNTYVWFATQQSNKSQSCVVRPSLPDWQSGITSGQSQHDVLLQKASGSYDLCIELVDSNWQQFSPRIYSAGYPITVIPNTTATKTWQPSTAGWGTPYCNNNASDIKWSQHSDSTYTGPKIARCYTTASGGAVSASMSEMTEADRNLTGQDCSAYNTGIVVKTRVDSGYNYRCTESTISSSSSGQSQASMLASIASILEAMKSAF